MAEGTFTAPRFTDEDAARAHLESIRWPSGPVCPHCGGTERNSRLTGKSHRPGLLFCGDCRSQFSVTVGTVFERSKIPLHKWILATHLLCSSKKGMSSHQIHRTLGVTYKTAWFMTHRIREAMTAGSLAPFGQGGGTVEVDETYIGQDRPRKSGHRGGHHKRKVLSLVDRNSGRAKSMVVETVAAKHLVPILRKSISRDAHVMTDDASWYSPLSITFASHSSVNHSASEYVSLADRTIHTNTVEGFFSIFKRGMKGVYQHCGKHHLHRYLTEFDFRYSNRAKLGVDDKLRTDTALKGISGKRLTYRRTNQEVAVAIA
jgi:transposase-like protein